MHCTSRHPGSLQAFKSAANCMGVSKQDGSKQASKQASKHRDTGTYTAGGLYSLKLTLKLPLKLTVIPSPSFLVLLTSVAKHAIIATDNHGSLQRLSNKASSASKQQSKQATHQAMHANHDHGVLQLLDVADEDDHTKHQQATHDNNSMLYASSASKQCQEAASKQCQDATRNHDMLSNQATKQAMHATHDHGIFQLFDVADQQRLAIYC
jgi:hypothetical protein